MGILRKFRIKTYISNTFSELKKKKKVIFWASLVVQWLRLQASRADGMGSIPGWGGFTCTQCSKGKKKKKSSSPKTRLTYWPRQWGQESIKKKKQQLSLYTHIYMYMTKRHVLQIPFLPQPSKEVSLLCVLPETHKHARIVPPLNTTYPKVHTSTCCFCCGRGLPDHRGKQS